MQYKERMKQIEREIISAVSCETLMDYTEHISRWVRISSTQGELDSLDYIDGVLKGFGYETKLLHYCGFISYPLEARVCVEGENPVTMRALAHCFTDSTKDGGITAPVTTDPGDCRGKIMMMDGLPNVQKIMEAKSKGAAAVICVQDNYLHNMPVNPIWGSPTEETSRYLPRIPVVSITRPDGGGIHRLMEKGEVALNLVSKVEMGWKKELPILVADLPAPGSDKFVLLSCHIDSWDFGAMDNGTANATAMECARLMAQHRGELARGLRIAFWSGHSQGKFCGSSWYADTHYEELEKNCIAHVNIDSTGGKGAVIIDEAPVMPQSRALAAEVIGEQTGETFYGNRIGHFADQSFFGVGLTSVFGTFSEQDPEGAGDSLSFKHGVTRRASGLGWWWHTEYDTIDKIDPQFLQRDTKIYAGVLWRLMTDAALPFDLTEAAEDMRQDVLALAQKLEGRFDLLPLIGRIEEVKERCLLLQQRLGALEDPDCAAARQANEIVQKAAQCLVRIQFHGGDVFDYDLGGSMARIPSLAAAAALAEAEPDSDEYHMLEIRLLRGYNRVMYYLAQAKQLLE